MSSQQNLKSLVQVPIDKQIETAQVQQVLSSPPFVQIQGTFNARDLSFHNRQLRQGFAFRTGTLDNVTTEGAAVLRDVLGIKKVFDLRSVRERERSPAPVIEGVDMVWVSSSLDDVASPEAIAEQEKKRQGCSSIAEMYFDILSSHKAAIKTVVTHVLNDPEQPFSFNCTAGKDRTAVVAFVLHALAGSSNENIDLDYALTRVGIEPVREFLLGKLTFAKTLDMTNPTIRLAASIPFDAMQGLAHLVDERLGGIKVYAVKQLGFSSADVERIRNNLQPSSIAI